MPTINQLNAIDSNDASGSDLLPVYSQSNGDARKLSLTNLSKWLAKSFAAPEFQTQWSTPQATGFSIQVADNGNNTWLIINPAAGYATGAITLPSALNAVDGQEVLVNCTQAVTTFTVNGNGAIDVLGEPATLAANGFFRLRFQAQTQIWYRVG